MEVRDEVVDYLRSWSDKADTSIYQLIGWLGIAPSKYYDWRERYGKVNEHNAWIPRDWYLEEWEKEAIIKFFHDHPLEGYRRLTYMMMDGDIVAVSPTSTYRVLKKAGLVGRHPIPPGGKGKGFEQPDKPHRHWHVDIAYLNICGTFYYLCSVLDGYSRSVVHWEIRESMTESDVATIIERAREQFPQACPRIITDNGPQFIAKDFKEYIRVCGLTHVRTAPYYPQSNGKIERWHKSLKSECIRPTTPLSVDDARRCMTSFVAYYNTVRLHSALGYVTPLDKLEGREQAIFAQREEKLAKARQERRERRQQKKQKATATVSSA